MKRRLFLAGLLLTGMLAAASADTRIILVGDSITGLSRNHARGYANQMDEALAACPPDEGPFTIVALGGSGQTVQSWQSVEKRSRGQPFTLDVKTIDVKTELSRPADILIVMLGMNNALAPHIEDTPESIEAWIACYRDLVAALRERCTPKRLVLCSVTPCTEAYDGPKNRLIRNMNAAVLRLCVELGAAYAKTGETVWRVMARGRRIAPDFHGTGDFVHPNAVGHAAIAAAMKDGVVTDAVCESCGQGHLILTGTEYTSWVSHGVEGAVPCVHHDPWRRDEVLERTAVKHYVCDRCGQSAQDSAQELQYVHHP